MTVHILLICVVSNTFLRWVPGYGMPSCCHATKKNLVVSKECYAWSKIWNTYFKVNCNQNLTSKRESHIYEVLSCSRYMSALLSLKLTVALEMKTGSTLPIWQAAVWLRNWYSVCLAVTINQFIHRLWLLNFLIL